MEYELYHHGIKGMRWGIRRYQNKDGSLTPAGEKRRAKLEGKLEKLGGSSKKSAGSDDAAQTTVKKRASDMSDAELDRAINRARKEDEYNRLRPEPTPAAKPRNHLMEDVLKPAVINAGRNFMQNAMNKAAESLLKGKVDPNSIEALRKTAEKLELENRIAKAKKTKEAGGDISWDEKIKQQTYENNKADREAKMEGYKDAIDKANQMRAGNAPTSSIPKSTVSSGKSYVDNYMELNGNNRDVLRSTGRRDDD